MKSACLKAGAKLGVGLSLLAAVIGIRLVTTRPAGIEAGIEELERLDAQITSEAIAKTSETLETSEKAPGPGDSIVSRLSAGIHDDRPSSASRSQEGAKLVSCRLSGSIHFMRADDCAMRGGESTVVSDED